jgi:hypothetical protein
MRKNEDEKVREGERGREKAKVGEGERTREDERR